MIPIITSLIAIVPYSFSNTLSETPPRNPKIPPTTAVTISVACICIPMYSAKQENAVAQIIARKICGRILPITPSAYYAAAMPLQRPLAGP